MQQKEKRSHQKQYHEKYTVDPWKYQGTYTLYEDCCTQEKHIAWTENLTCVYYRVKDLANMHTQTCAKGNNHRICQRDVP
jgi:hypothetical protein